MLFTERKKNWIPFVKILSIVLGYGIIFFLPKGFLLGLVLTVFSGALLFWAAHQNNWVKTLDFLFQTLLLDTLIFLSLLFISSTFLVFLLILVGIFLNFLLWRTHLTFWYNKGKYEPFSYENIVNVITVFLLYLLGLNGSAFIIFLGFRPWMIHTSFAIMMLVLATLYFRTYHIDFPKNLFLGALTSLLAEEVFWALGLLPLGFPVIGLLFTTLLYFTISIFRFYALESLNRFIWKRYTLLTVIIIILTLFTARWS